MDDDIEFGLFEVATRDDVVMKSEPLTLRAAPPHNGRASLGVWVGHDDRSWLVDAEDLERAVRAARILAENSKLFERHSHPQ